MRISWKAARIEKGLSQKEAAKELGIAEKTLVSYEKYKTLPKAETLSKMIALYDIPVENIKIFLS